MKREAEIHSWQIVGPLAMLAAFSLAIQAYFPVDLVVSGLLGLFLSARLQVRGCFYAWTLLVVVGIFAHLFVDASHFWRLGLEASFACSFLITALAFENNAIDASTRDAQLAAKESAIDNLQQEMTGMGERLAEQSMASSLKIESLQKLLEEVQSEKNSLEILNDVLRRVNAGHFVEKKAMEEQRDEERRQIAQCLLETEEIDALRRERNDLKDQLIRTEDKVQSLVQIESLYKQLKMQFSEKNRILHETRSALFKTDTELQTMRIEQDQRCHAALPMPTHELECVEEEMMRLEEEAGHLQEIVTHLTGLCAQPSLETLREAFSLKKRVIPIPGQPTAEQTLREALASKRKKKPKKLIQENLLLDL